MKPNLSSAGSSGTNHPVSSSSRSSHPSSSAIGGLLPTTVTSPLVSSTTPPASEEPSPTDLLLATPPTLLKLFALSAPFVSIATTFCQLVTWQHPNFFASLLVLLGWWAVCLFGRWLAKYGFNAAILVFILSRYFRTASKQVTGKSSSSSSSSSNASTGIGSSSTTTSSYRHARPPTLTPAAYSQLLTSSHFLFSHLHALRTSVLHPLSLQFSFTPVRPSTPAPAYQTAKLAITSYPFYLVVTYLIPVRYLFLTLGSIAILWQAPFFKTLRRLIWKSMTIRWLVRLILCLGLKSGQGFKDEWNKTTRKGVGLPGLLKRNKVYNDKNMGSSAMHGRQARGGGIDGVEEKVVKTSSIVKPTVTGRVAVEDVKSSSISEVDRDKLEEGEDVEVQFTVFENQRWWVGLDWTHALLPGERASWTDPSLNPSNPPASFNLPPPQIIYLPSPTAADPLSRLKKTTSWRWLDPEWKVLRESIPSVALPVSPALPPSPTSTATVSTTGLGTTPATGESPPSPNPVHTSSSIFSSLPSPPSNLLSASLSSSPPSSAVAPHQPVPATFSSPTLLISDPHSKLFDHWVVDAEGWQYGDNHFEKMGPKGGLGKYTRRRAWVRRAGLVETTERIHHVPHDVDNKDKNSLTSSNTPGARGTTSTSTHTTTDQQERGRKTSFSNGGSSVVEKLRRKSESRHSSSGGSSTLNVVEGGSSTGTRGGSGGGGGTTGQQQARKRKSMPPTVGSQHSISKDVD